MKEAFLLLFFIALVIITWCIFKNNNEGFTDIHTKQASLAKRQLAHYGNVPISLITSNKWGALGETGNNMLRTPDYTANYPLTQKDGIWKIVEKCESINTMDCSAFDDPEFSLNCGVCLDIGKNHANAPATGGLVLLPADKKAARDGNQSNFIPEYVPTLGFCPARKLVSTKEECLQAQREILCEKNGSFDIPGCAQCYSDGKFSIVDSDKPGVVSGYGRIVVVGVGILTIREEGFDPRTNITLKTNKPFAFDLRATEGKTLKISLSPPANSTDMNPINPYIAGYMIGRTFNGEWTQDLRQIVIIDEVTGRKPRSSGAQKLNGVDTVKMGPGFGQTTMTISVSIPFTFVEPTTKEASECKGGPFVTTPASANFLESDACYNKESGPGKYTQECLQNTWITNGCTTSGKGYPSDMNTNAILMTAEDGLFRTINDISDYIYNLAIITATGVDQNGKKQSIDAWSNASYDCTGNIITSPCDLPNSKGGTLSPDCIIYLWDNQGSKKLWNGQNSPIGPTYYTSDAISLFKEGSTLRACQATGTLSPVNKDGSIKNNIVAYWQSKGDLNTVKKLMADLHRAANAQAVSDDQIAPYFTQCYGNINFAKPIPYVPPPPPPPVVLKDKTDKSYVEESSITIAQHCDNTGWKKTLGLGSWKSLIHYPTDTSYITVPIGITANLTTRQGLSHTVYGPGVFNFCTKQGFNDNVSNILVTRQGETDKSYVEESSITIAQHCDNTGWKKTLGLGTWKSLIHYPTDISYITVPTGVTANLTTRQGLSHTVYGPGVFNFCTKAGFNDNVSSILVTR